MESRSLILPLLLPFFFSAFVSADDPTVPPPSSSPSPLPHSLPPNQLPPSSLEPVYGPPPPNDANQEDASGVDEALLSFERLNIGEKVGLMFIAVAVALQVAFAGFLVFKRVQLTKMEHEERPGEELSSASL